MKIIFQPTGNDVPDQHAVEVTTRSDEVTGTEIRELLRYALAGWGYHPVTVAEILGDEPE